MCVSSSWFEKVEREEVVVVVFDIHKLGEI